MATRKTINFLPEIFKTETNKKFLNATLDQLISEPDLVKVNGFIGRKLSSAFAPSKNYVVEAIESRNNYQLEPAVVVKNSSNQLDLYSDYQDLLDKIEYYGGIVDNHDRLFDSEYYRYDPHIDLDKFVNYNQYYWLPDGPNPVTVSSGTPATPKTFTMTRGNVSYTSDQTGNITNPTITLVRGVTYQFAVNQPGHNFYIQTEPGTDGLQNYNINVTTRSISGVVNNGADSGNITFAVPAKDAQDYYFKLPFLDYVDYAVANVFSSIDGAVWRSNVAPSGSLTSLDNVSRFPQGSHIIFLSNSTDNNDWIDNTGAVVPTAQRHGLWSIKIDSVTSRIKLQYVRDIPIGYKLRVKYGDVNAGYEFFKNSLDQFAQSPPITAPLSTLYYQDGTSANAYGRINIVDLPGDIINVDTAILGKLTYTSPNGIKFTNGLKITFDGSVTPAAYQNKTYIVEGVGLGIRLVDFSLLNPVEAERGESSIAFDTLNFDIDRFDQPVQGASLPDYIVSNRASTDLNAWARTNRWFHSDVILKTAEYTNSIPNINQLQQAQRPIIEFEADLQLYRHGRVGLGVIDRYDSHIVTVSPSNSWVKIYNAFAQIENKKVSDPSIAEMKYVEGQLAIFPNDLDAAVRSRVYRVDFQNQQNAVVFDGTGTGLLFVQAGNDKVIDGTTPAQSPKTTFLTELEVGSLIYTPAGTFIGKVKTLVSNSEIILEQPATTTLVQTGFKYNSPRIELNVVRTAEAYDTAVATVGPAAKNSFFYNGTNWILGQQKTKNNQAPLFDVINSSDVSFSTAYPGSTFSGTKIFSYRPGSSAVDSVLGLSLSYSNVGGSIGDINFDNNFETDTFTYGTLPNTQTENISLGYLRKNLGRTAYQIRNVWSTVAEPAKQYQHITGEFDGQTNYFEIDILPAAEIQEPNIKVYVNNKIISASSFTIQTVGIRRAVRIEKTLTLGDVVDIFIYSKSISQTGYYQIPKNLDFNAKNQAIGSLTLGQLRGHWYEIGQNTRNVQGDIASSSNLRDLDTRYQSGTILQHSAPTIYGSLFLIDNQVNLINSIDYARADYTKFKNKFLELCLTLPGLNPQDPANGVDTILKTINQVKNSKFAWYYSDMVPWGDNFVVDQFKVTNTATKTYSLANIYSAMGTKLYSGQGMTNQAIGVYLNGTQLVVEQDYTIGSNSPQVTLSAAITLAVNDIILVRGYLDTDGSYVPETPTKLGLYPKFIPTQYTDNTYIQSTTVIQGHDGSITPTFGDLRDAYLLELEKRIYNNIKVEYDPTLFNISTVIPGKFRSNDYSRTEFNRVLTTEFLKWVGSNQLDYSTNETFNPNNQFTWNYNQTNDQTGETLAGYWRGIYKYYYDTDRPHTHPWEMLGYAIKPSWWNTHYGAGPYTSNSTQMWTDLENGYSRGTNTTNTLYARSGLGRYIPVDSSGNLLPPMSKLVKNFDGTKFSQSYSIGDHGPVESAWHRTSEYPFALQRTLALLKPAKYFGLLFDTTKNYKNSALSQYVIKITNRRITAESIVINGETVQGTTSRASGYLNWIHGYLTNFGVDASSRIRSRLNNLDVRLGYKVGGYTDKKYITALVEQFSPTSTNESVIIPDENYLVHLNKSVPTRRATYSAVIIEKTSTGYSLRGYNLKNPYFTIIPSEFNNNYYAIESLGVRAVIFQDYRAEKITIPYGYEFSNSQQVVDFLVGYQRYLTAQGFVFDSYDSDLKQLRDWVLSAREFLTWSQQGWKPGNIIVLSPVLDSLTVYENNAVVDTITNQSNESRILGANFNVIKLEEISVLRQPNLTTITTTLGRTIAFADLNLVQYEHALVFDNVTVFNDIVYKPELGSRQYRVKLIGSKTGSWNGAMSPPGFIYKSGKIEDWRANTDYKKADIVKYKNQNYTAIQNISGSTSFDFNYWSLLDTQVESEIVPNFAQAMAKSVDFYDIDRASIDEDFDRFSMGLIGYRSRSYLENLGMDQITQSKFYQGFIKEKGTAKSVSALYKGNFDNVVNELSLYEEWALRVGEYGAMHSNQSIELVLDESKFKGNPAAFKILNSQEASTDTVLTVRPQNLLTKPAKFQSPILLNRPLGESFEGDIKTAGYVHLDDIDGQLFDLNNYSTLNSSVLSEIETDYKLWVAKDFDTDWQVYLVVEANNPVLSIEYALSNRVQITTTYDHGVQSNDIVAVRNFGTKEFDGFYKVLFASSPTSFVVEVSDTLVQFILGGIVESSGEFFVLQKSRYRTTAARDGDVTKVSWTAGDIVWVDNTGNNTWATYEFVSSTPGNYSSSTAFWGIENQAITIRSTGLPAHSYGVNVNIANVATTFLPSVKNYNRSWPLNAGANVVASTERLVYSEVVGFAINGVPLASANAGDYAPPNYQTVNGYNYNFVFTNANVSYSRDTAGGLITQDESYYYQSYSFANAWTTGSGGITANAQADALGSVYLNGSLTHTNGHSKILGFSNDGYPIYGPYGYSQAMNSSSAVQRMTSGYSLRNSSYRDFYVNDLVVYPMGIFVQDYEFTNSGSLDRHNGRYCVTPEYPNGTYAYFMTVSNTGVPVYPYIIGDSYYGPVPEVYNSLTPGQGAVPQGFVGTHNLQWTLKSSQQPVVDINSIGGMHIYSDNNKTILSRLDIFDPVKGKILGTAQADLDYISSFDPAKYNSGSLESLPIEEDFHWGVQQVGKIWWDISSVRYLDYEQGTRNYRLEHWGELFPGSSVEVYEWVESDTLPSGYAEALLEGVPKYSNDSAYTSMSFVDTVTGIIQTKYYYWIRARTTVAQSKNHSVLALEQIIGDPVAQNIPYAAAISNNTLALYNIGSYVSKLDAVLHIDYRVKLNQDIIHSEFELFQQGNQYSVMHPRIENKLIDSLVGQDIAGNTVPEPGLARGDLLGLSVRPRQTLIENRYLAAENVIKYANSVLINYPIARQLINKETVYSDNFYAATPLPVYDYAVDTYSQFSYVPKISAGSFEVGKQYIITDIGTTSFTAIGASSNTIGTVFTATGIGAGTGKAYPRRILVQSDANYLNRWTLYFKNVDASGTVNKYQALKVADFWSLVDWYASGYNSKTKVNYSVDRFVDIYKLTLVNGDVVRVLDNGAQQFELYVYQNGKYMLVGAQSGTVQIKSDLYRPIGYDYANFDANNYDYNYASEFRYILQGLKQDIFINDLAPEWNKLLFFVIEYILSEQKYIDWAFKTSFVSAQHRVEGLKQTPAYIKDRQLYYKQYVEEVKPYRTKLREYSMSYSGLEEMSQATVTDFDLPAYYDSELEVFRSPSGEVPAKDVNLINTDPRYQDWKNHHKYQLESILVAEKGRGFVVEPDVTVVSADTTGLGANARSIISSDGSLFKITVTNAGKDYTQTPIVVLTGTGSNAMSPLQQANFLPARITPRISNSKVRKIKTTIKFDRITYTTDVVDWAPNVAYPAGTIVSYNGQGYQASAAVPAANVFSTQSFTLVNSGSFTNANDRIMAFYKPTGNMLPKVFYRLMSGFDDVPQANATTVTTVDSIISGGGFTGTSVNAGSFVIGQKYIITYPGTTNFVGIGAINSQVGTVFTATGAGSGTGRAAIAISPNVALGNVAGISSEEIVVQGGAFVSALFGRGPEELLPGRVFESVSIFVRNNGVSGNVGYRKFIDMNGGLTNSVVDLSTITTLAQPLKITDTTITVTDASVLPTPNAFALQPGKICVNGERIEYYTKVGNVLGQIRRGVGGTGAPAEHASGSTVESTSNTFVNEYI